jgi:hypothetical protein
LRAFWEKAAWLGNLAARQEQYARDNFLLMTKAKF